MENKIKVDLSAIKSQRNMNLRSQETLDNEINNKKVGSDLAHVEKNSKRSILKNFFFWLKLLFLK